MKHGKAEVAPGVRLHYGETGTGPRTVVLLHGFPQTGHEWARVVPRLSAAGLRVVVPDYRGAGGSSKPATGYDKATMAADILVLVRVRLGISGPVILVGHDMGAMIAIAYALRYRDEVSHLVVIDASIPGTRAFDDARGDSRGWQLAFHSARDVAELLVQGHERRYLQHLIAVRIFNPSAMSRAAFETYVHAYEAPGAMRAAFELFRAFDADAAALRTAVDEKGKLRVPTLVLTGAMSGLAGMAEMMSEVAEGVASAVVPDSGHWVPEENPAFVADAVLSFVRA